MGKQKYSTKFHRNTYFLAVHIVLRKIKFFIFFLLLTSNFNHYSDAHMRGTFSSEQEALKKSLELDCKGTHKNQDKWLPCENEKELHKYLRM